MPEVVFSKEGSIASIVLNRPEAYNSINGELARLLIDALDDCASDTEIRAVVISGSGKAFCAGQDLKEVTSTKFKTDFAHLLNERYSPIVTKISTMEKPVIAAVNGVAAGAGANLALACDVVIASEKASFIQAFSAIGLIPDTGGTYFLPRLVGRGKAMGLTMTGDKVMASEAEQMGMIYKCVEVDKFADSVKDLTEKLSNLPTKALGLTKKAINTSYQNSFLRQVELETELQIRASETKDFSEGISAFVEKRKPNFKGE